MIRFLKGIFHPSMDGTAVIETKAGIGFLISLPANSGLYKHFEGDEVKVYTLMIVREDDMSLYGFETKEELELFKLLITVNGVGAKAGMSIMGILPQMDLRRAIATGDVKTISTANGVGKKTAERIILDLKDKVGDFVGENKESGGVETVVITNERSEAITALVSLGYSRTEAEQAVGKVSGESLSTEDYIKLALKQM